MATVTIKNGTPVGTESLCNMCRHVHRQKGFRESEELVICTYVWESARLMPFKVAECTNFSERDTLTMYEMKEMALLINTATSAKSAGFQRGVEDKIAAVASDSEVTIK